MPIEPEIIIKAIFYGGYFGLAMSSVINFYVLGVLFAAKLPI